MKVFYFPEQVYTEAHCAFIRDTGIDPEVALVYCMKHWDFFVEVAFSYVERTPWPVMEVL